LNLFDLFKKFFPDQPIMLEKYCIFHKKISRWRGKVDFWMDVDRRTNLNLLINYSPQKVAIHVFKKLIIYD